MPRERNTKTHNIFLLDRSKLQDAFTSGEETPIPELLELLMATDANYHMQSLKDGLNTSGFSVKLFFRGEDNYQSKFASFCKPFVSDGEEAVTFHPRTASSVLFIWNDRHVFAITTGQGYRMIELFAVPKFGMMIASAFQQRFKITSLDSNAMSSIIHSTKTVYSNEVDFIDVEALDTIFKEVTGRLNDAANVHTLLNLPATSKKRSMKITAKDYVQFSSSMNFDGLIHLLTIIDGYNFDHLRDRFNLITPLTNKKHHLQILANNDAVLRTIYESIVSGSTIPFDLFHRNTNDFISADTYVIYGSESFESYTEQEDYDATQLISTAYLQYLNGSPMSEASFFAFWQGVRLRADRGDYTVTDGTLMQHISGEVEVAGTNFYIFYGDYYRLNEAYSERLKDSLRGKLRPEFYTSEIQTVWSNGMTEHDFNKAASTAGNYVHLHTVTPDNIGFCDLLKASDDYVTVVHVKDGFNNEMRALDRQVELSITKIMDLKHNNQTEYMKELYRRGAACDKGLNITTAFATEDEFIANMKDKQIRYIIAIRPANSNLLDGQSNIAKHCLNALILRCFNQGIDLRIQVL